MKLIVLPVALSIIVASAAAADRTLPVDNGRVTSGIGWRADPFGSGRMTYHRGIDIAVPERTPVFPVRKGTVLFAGSHKGYGNLVVVDHGDGFVSFYGHNSSLTASPGQRVDSRTVIALSGNTGRSTGPHVHFETGRRQDYLGRWHADPGKTPEPVTNDEYPDLSGGLATGGGNGEALFALPSDQTGTADIISLQPN
jgi:murein DD-endopeptidase MepM/ murein hydrolase activator NlpD